MWLQSPSFLLWRSGNLRGTRRISIRSISRLITTSTKSDVTSYHDGRGPSRRETTRRTARQEALAFEVLNRSASAHFIGGIPIGDTSESGAADPYQRVFGQPGLHVMDGSVM